MTADTPMAWRVVLGLGRRYLGRHRALTAAYLAGLLLTMSLLPVGIATTYGRLTTFFQSGATGAPRDGAAAEPPAGASPGAASTAGTRPPIGALEGTYLLWAVLALGTVALGAGHRYLTAYFAAVLERDLRVDVFTSMLRQSPRYFHEHSSDELQVIVNQWSSLVQVALRQLLLDPVVQVAGLLVIATTVYRALLDLGGRMGPRAYALVAAVAAVVCLAPIVVMRMRRRLERETSTLQQQDLAMATLVGGALAAPEEVQALEAEAGFAAKYRALLGTGIRAQLDQTRTIERLNAANALPGQLVLIALIGVAILLLAGNSATATPYTIVAVGLLTPQLMSGVQALASFSINASLTWPAVRDVDEALHPRAEVTVSPEARDLTPADGSVEGRALTFSYRPGETANVLDGLSFTVPAGAVVGLVARSGGGKTSVFRLLLRFYDPQRGDLLLGGVPIRAYTIASLRRHVALMTQESAFFHDTVRENFRVAAPEATDQAIRALCDRTGMWPILEQVFGPRPLDAPFAAGELSGGQRKRLALTRALLRQPSVVLLDEPTVGIDQVDKVALVDVIRQACAGRTVISVEQDLVWQTRLCDRFLVLDRGAIVESGTSEELLARPGLFRELYEASRNEHVRAPRQAPAPAPLGMGARVKTGGPPVAERA